MWRDIGLGEWLFDMDEPSDVAKLVPAVLALAQDAAGSRATAAKGREFVQRRQAETMGVVKKNLIV